MTRSPIHPGAVAWTGENPGIYLKDTQDGPWTGLATFFRITWSPYGRGCGVLLLDQPNVEKGLPEVQNFLISDNEKLARYLVSDFFSKFASFRVSPGIKAITYLPLTAARRDGDAVSSYAEIVASNDLEVVMRWNKLGAPYAVDMPPEKGPTQRHEMYSLFLDSPEASVTVNGKPLKGKVMQRDFADTKKPTAFLAFSESWMEV
ncbi:MAG: hypothetical protein J0H78_18675 [Rhizobiales bacterium]|nr:hypothetical protein [Hyphomicrobiales bacterium]OJY44220.1 MAG: hypothetical protein BGP08_08425 [Rhizobiales bacterium 64-17]